MRLIDNTLISAKSRKGLLPTDFFTGDTSSSGRPSPDNQNDLLALLQDSTVAGIIEQQIAKLSSGSMMFKGDKSKTDELRKRLKEMKEPRKRRGIYANLLLYHNAFYELIYKGSNVSDIDLLETREMEIVETKNGKLLGYVQENDKGKVGFTPLEVVHFKVTQITLDSWGYAFNKHLIRIVNHKLWVQNFLHWLVKTNQFRNFFTAKEAGDKASEFLTYLRQAENHPTKHLIADGDITTGVLRDFADGGNFLSLINYYNSEIYRLLQAPPIVAGTVDNSNRSNSEAQLSGTYYSWLTFIRDTYLDYFNSDLLPRMGYDDIEAFFTPIDGVLSKDEVIVATGLKGLGMNSEGIKQFLEQGGFDFSNGAKLEEPEDDSNFMKVNKNNTFSPPPSRQPQDNFNNRKFGSESSTREEQLGSKSYKVGMKFTEYPYVYSVI